MQVAASDELRGLSEQGRAVEPVVAAGDDEGRRSDRHRAVGQIKAVLSLDGGRHVCPVPGTAHQPVGEQPAGRSGYGLPPPWRHQPRGRGRRGAPIRAAPDGGRDLGLQCFADRAQTAGGADKRQPASTWISTRTSPS